MSGVGSSLPWFALPRDLLAIILVAFAVKLMDDFLDLRTDVQFGIPSIAERLGEASLPYAMLLLALGSLLDLRLAIPLFTASYGMGMAMDLRRELPSGLYGWQEAVIAIGAGALLIGPLEQVWALVVMGFVQCMDDIQDVRRDALSGASNLVRRFGVGEVRMVAFFLLCVSAVLSPLHTGMVIVSVAVVERVVWRAATYGPRLFGSYPRGWAE